MKCSLLNFSNRRRTSFFYSCRSFALISFYFDLSIICIRLFLRRFCPSSLDFRLFYSRLCATLSLYPPSFFIHQVFNEKNRYLAKANNSCVIIVSNVMRCSRFNPSSINNRESTRGFRVFIQNNFVKYLMVLRRNLVIVDKKIKMLTFFFYIIIID